MIKKTYWRGRRANFRGFDLVATLSTIVLNVLLHSFCDGTTLLRILKSALPIASKQASIHLFI